MKSAASSSPASRRRGETLVECLVALAFAGLVFVPASAALRAAVRRDADTASRVAAAVALRPAALSAAARLRLGAADAPGADRAPAPGAAVRVRDAAFADDIPEGLPRPRAVLAEVPGAAVALLPFPSPRPEESR